MPFYRGLTSKNIFSSVFAVRRKKEKDCYLKNGSCVLEELLALCDGNCRIPIRYFSAIEIHNAIRHSKSKMYLSDVSMVTGLLDNRPVLVRFNTREFNNIHRDIAITAQMSHLKNVLRLVGCCLEFEQPVMVYEYVEGISLFDLLFKKDNLNRKSLSWGNRLRIANEVASAIVFLHTEFTTPIIHREINPHKVIIDQKSGVAKILDFSVSISLPPGESEAYVFRIFGGISTYRAPEYAMSGLVTQKIDVYSFGVLLLQLLTGKNVYDIMKRVYSTNSTERIDFEEDAKSNTEEDNTLDRVDSTTSKERIDFEEDARSSTEEGSTFYSMDSKDKGTTYIDLVNGYIKEGNVMDLADPIILEDHGTEIQQQLHDCFDLVKKCIAGNEDDRPYMIHVARELCRIEKCFRALTLGQN
ncbi:hypothetical protein KY290_028302 [Solanum tuberosum]|uniref:Protein kinase domain-containing protein n=1 Tax=Solanum tuberosum TaxID=4113 RepID=A0ABQ7UHI3_SOLTU|nr:hypothetical protein KY290_028302 [Solanum tuberosum]